MKAVNALLQWWRRGSHELAIREVIALAFVVALIVFYVWFVATHLGGMRR